MKKTGTPLRECLWRIDEKKFFIAIAGTGPGFRSIVEIVSNEQYSEFLPDMEIVAIAEPDYNSSTVERLREQGIKIYSTCEAMPLAHPDIDLLVELAGKRFRLKKIRDSLSDSISLLDHTAAIFIDQRGKGADYRFDQISIAKHCTIIGFNAPDRRQNKRVDPVTGADCFK